MRTATTKQVELLSFEKLSTVSILLGASRVVYTRHKVGIDLFLVSLVAVVGWAWAFYQAFNG